MRRLERALKPFKTLESKKGREKKSSTLKLRLTPAQHQRREQVHESFRQVQGLYEQGRKAGDASLTPYLPYLHKRWKAGCQNGLQLWRELRARGYMGSASTVKPYVALLRQVPEDLLPPMFSRQEKQAPEEAFSVRLVIWLALSRPEQLTREQTQELAQVCSLSAPVATALTLAQEFVKMLREKQVEAALSRPESNGQTEGHVTRLKLIKREMYGRARFDLLRLRVIHAA